MSNDALVGLELLPNIYIKNIEVYSGSSNMVKVKVSACVLDKEENGQMIWSDKEEIKSVMSVLFVASSEPVINNLITTGALDFSRKSIRKESARMMTSNFSHSQPTIATRPMASVNRTSVEGDYTYFHFDFEFMHKLSKPELKIFAAVFLDERALQSGNNTLKAFSKISFYGPISSESIYENSNLNTSTYVFLNSDGSQYVGPVHFHPDKGYMQGSYHRQTSHPTVERTQVFNYKIKDFRDNQITEDHNLKDQDFTAFTPLYDSLLDDGTIAGVFGINLKDIVLYKTKYGNSLKSLSPKLFKRIINNFQIKRLLLKRDRIKIEVTLNDLGSPRETYNGSMGSQEVVLSRDGRDNTFLRNRTRLEKGGYFYDVVISELNNSQDVTGKPDEVFSDQLSQYNYVGSIKEINMSEKRNGLRYFEFKDYLLNDNRIGYHMYDVEMSFKDPTIMVVEEIFNKSLDALQKVKLYRGNMLTFSYYDYDKNQTKSDFYELQNSKYSEDYNKAPWIAAPRQLWTMYSYLYNFSEVEEAMEMMLDKYSSMLNPKFATATSINHFVSEYESIISRMSEVFDIKPSQIVENSLKSYPRNTAQTTIVDIEHRFENIFVPYENRTRFNFLEITDSTEIAKLTPEEYLSRLTTENQKLFTTNTTSTAGMAGILEAVRDPELDGVAKEALSNTNSGMAKGYLSPLGVRKTTQYIDLKDPNSVDLDTLNGMFERVIVKPPHTANREMRTISHKLDTKVFMPKPNNFSLALPSKLNVSDIEDEESIHVNSEDYFGFDSEFVSYGTGSLSVIVPKGSTALGTKGFKRLDRQLSKISREPVVTRKDFDINSKGNLLNKMKRNKSMSSFKRKLSFMPNQIRALFLSKSKVVKTSPFAGVDTLVQKDVELLSKVTHLTVARVEYLSGYQISEKTGEVMFNKPIWSAFNADDLSPMEENYFFCRMSYYEDPEYGLQLDERTNIAYTNKYFFIARDLQVTAGEETQSAFDIDQELDYLETFDLDVMHLRSNVMVQTNNYFSDTAFVSDVEQPRVRSSSGQGTQSATTTQTSAPAINTSGPSPKMGGGY